MSSPSSNSKLGGPSARAKNSSIVIPLFATATIAPFSRRHYIAQIEGRFRLSCMSSHHGVCPVCGDRTAVRSAARTGYIAGILTRAVHSDVTIVVRRSARLSCAGNDFPPLRWTRVKRMSDTVTAEGVRLSSQSQRRKCCQFDKIRR